MITHVEKWFCCLNPAERLAMILCAGNAGPVTFFVLKTLFDAVFVTAIEGSVTERKELFVNERYMTYGTLPPEDPDGIEVYYLGGEYWSEINAYLDERGASCAEPCKILTFSA